MQINMNGTGTSETLALAGKAYFHENGTISENCNFHDYFNSFIIIVLIYFFS